MKYLKPFNENTDNFKEELQDFCETNLAYLLDEGTEIQIVEQGYEGLHQIRILLDKPKKWNDIKDHIIPFLTRLQNQYEINNKPFKESSSRKYKAGDIRLNIVFDEDDTRSGGSYITGQVKDLIEDKGLWSNAIIVSIRLYVKGYKKEKKSILSKIKTFFK